MKTRVGERAAGVGKGAPRARAVNGPARRADHGHSHDAQTGAGGAACAWDESACDDNARDDADWPDEAREDDACHDGGCEDAACDYDERDDAECDPPAWDDASCNDGAGKDVARDRDACADPECDDGAWRESACDDARVDAGYDALGEDAARARGLGPRRARSRRRPPLKRELTVGEVAKRTGVAVSALRFYESKGLIKIRRSAGNHRLYPREVLRRIAVIKVAQRTGLSLDEIRTYLAQLPDSRRPTKADWTRLSTAWKADLQERIAQLIRLRDQLDECIGCGCLSLADCPLRNPDDELAAEGPGPRLLLRSS